MRANKFRAALLGLGVVLCLGAAAYGGTALAGRSAGPVPSNVAQQIHDQYGSRGFVPTRIPGGYGFRDWGGGATSFGITFGPDNTQEMQFGVNEVPCASMGNSMHTFQENGVSVEWNATYEDQQAWRCLTVDGTSIVVSANRSVPGDDNVTTPQGLQDAQQLADLVAYAQTS